MQNYKTKEMRKKDVQHEVLIGRLASIERHLDRIEERLSPTDASEALQPQIEVGSWWLGNYTEEKAQVTKVEELVYCTYEDGAEVEYKPKVFKESFIPCEAPQPEIEVGSWYLNGLTDCESQVIKVEGKVVFLQYGDLSRRNVSINHFLINFKLCEATEPQIEVGSWWVGNTLGEKVKVRKITDNGIQLKYNGTILFLDKDFFLEHFTPCEAPQKEKWYLCVTDYTSGYGVDFKRGHDYKLTRTQDNGAWFDVDGDERFINNPFERDIMASPIER